jgi:hypothetical protein
MEPPDKRTMNITGKSFRTPAVTSLFIKQAIARHRAVMMTQGIIFIICKPKKQAFLVLPSDTLSGI